MRRAAAGRLAIATGVVLALLGCALAIASESVTSSAQEVIEARQSGFKKMGAALKAISEQLKTDTPDIAKMTSAAQAISSGVHEQPNWFPAGSGPESGVETDALPNIWKDPAKFAALSSQLATESGNFAAAIAGKDIGAIRTRFKALADVCSGCHKSFRAD